MADSRMDADAREQPHSDRDARGNELVIEGQKKALELVVHGAPLGEVLEVIVRTVETQSPTQVLGSILLLDADGKHLRHGAGPSLPAEYNAAIDGISIGPAVGSCGTAAFTGKTVVVSDIQADPLWADFRALADQHGLRSCWSTPIRAPDGAVLGTFGRGVRDRAVDRRARRHAACSHTARLRPRDRQRLPWRLPSQVAPAARPAVAARKRRADELLAALGFSLVPDAAGRLIEEPIPRLLFDKARLALIPDVYKVRAVRGNDALVEADSPAYRTNWATLLPGMIAYGWRRPAREGCEGMDPSGVTIIHSPRLP